LTHSHQRGTFIDWRVSLGVVDVVILVLGESGSTIGISDGGGARYFIHRFEPFKERAEESREELEQPPSARGRLCGGVFACYFFFLGNGKGRWLQDGSILTDCVVGGRSGVLCVAKTICLL
jgi:hypothetical protein